MINLYAISNYNSLNLIQSDLLGLTSQQPPTNKKVPAKIQLTTWQSRTLFLVSRHHGLRYINLMSEDTSGIVVTAYITAQQQPPTQPPFRIVSHYVIPIYDIPTFLAVGACLQEFNIKSVMEVAEQDLNLEPFSKVVDIIYRVDGDRDKKKQWALLKKKMDENGIMLYEEYSEAALRLRRYASYQEYVNQVISKCFSSQHGWIRLKLDAIKSPILDSVYQWLKNQFYQVIRLKDQRHFLIQGQIQEGVHRKHCKEIEDIQLEIYHNWYRFFKTVQMVIHQATSSYPVHVAKAQRWQQEISKKSHQIQAFLIACEEFHLYFHIKFEKLRHAAEMLHYYDKEGWNQCIDFNFNINQHNVLQSKLPPIKDLSLYYKISAMDQDKRLNIIYSYHNCLGAQKRYKFKAKMETKDLMLRFLNYLKYGYSHGLNQLGHVLHEELKKKLDNISKLNHEEMRMVENCIFKLYYNIDPSKKILRDYDSLKTSQISQILGEGTTYILAEIAKRVSFNETNHQLKELEVPSINSIREEIYRKFTNHHQLKISIHGRQKQLLHYPINVVEMQVALGKIRQPFHFLTHNQARRGVNDPQYLLQKTFKKDHILLSNSVPVCILPPPSSSTIKKYRQQLKMFIRHMLQTWNSGVIIMDDLFQYGVIKLKGYSITKQQKKDIANELVEIFQQINPCPVYHLQDDTWSCGSENLRVQFIEITGQNRKVVLRISVQPTKAYQRHAIRQKQDQHAHLLSLQQKGEDEKRQGKKDNNKEKRQEERKKEKEEKNEGSDKSPDLSCQPSNLSYSSGRGQKEARQAKDKFKYKDKIQRSHQIISLEITPSNEGYLHIERLFSRQNIPQVGHPQSPS